MKTESTGWLTSLEMLEAGGVYVTSPPNVVPDVRFAVVVTEVDEEEVAVEEGVETADTLPLISATLGREYALVVDSDVIAVVTIEVVEEVVEAATVWLAIWAGPAELRG